VILSDDEEARAAIGEALSSDDFLEIAADSAEASPVLREELRPDLVIVDLDGPSRIDADFFSGIARFDSCLPVVVIGDSKQRTRAAGALESGAHGFLEKPLEPAIVRSTVQRALEYRGLALFQRNHRRITEETIEEKTREIVRTRDFLRGILDSSTLVSVVLTDLSQDVLFWNKGAENIFGYTAEEMIGKSITRLYPPDALARDTVRRLRKMVQRKTGTVHGKMKQLSKDGRVLTLSLALSPMVDAQGELRGILGVGLDVTEEVRQTEEILNLLVQIKKTQDVTILALAKLAESRDEETGVHLVRIREYCRVLCDHLATRPAYQEAMARSFIVDLVRSCVLHDIGKVAIPDEILMSTQQLTPEERAVMNRHPLVGGRAIEEAVRKLGETSFLSVGMEVAYYHHERWDGTGYPFGLKGEEIPLCARLVAIADVYDALTTERRYKRAFSHEEACEIIIEGKGRHFDPDLVAGFEEVAEEFKRIRAASCEMDWISLYDDFE